MCTRLLSAIQRLGIMPVTPMRFGVSCCSRLRLHRVDKFDPVTSGCKVEHSNEALGELVISGGKGAVGFEVADHALDPIAHA